MDHLSGEYIACNGIHGMQDLPKNLEMTNIPQQVVIEIQFDLML